MTTQMLKGETVGQYALRLTGKPEPVESITPTPRNTRPHRVLSVGRQHADDQGQMGQCMVCHTVGEWNALVDLLPNAYGCAGRPLDE